MTGRLYSNHQSCPGKIPYKNRVDAQQASKRFGKKKHTTVQAYQCRACQQWHIGRHNNRSKRPKEMA